VNSYAEKIAAKTAQDFEQDFRAVGAKANAKAWGVAAEKRVKEILSEGGMPQLIAKVDRPGSFLEAYAEMAALGRWP
jgi:hypothetical protein